MTGNTGGTGNAAAATGNIPSAARAADGTTKPKKPKTVKCRQQHPLDPLATLKEKRKKKVAKFLNPLFLCWLEEWKSEARAKNNMNLGVYFKAIKSLKKYPTSTASISAPAARKPRQSASTFLNRQYISVRRSGAYALLFVLRVHFSPGQKRKIELSVLLHILWSK